MNAMRKTFLEPAPHSFTKRFLVGGMFTAGRLVGAIGGATSVFTQLDSALFRTWGDSIT